MEFYIAADGAYLLDIENPEIAALKNALARERAALKETKAHLAALDRSTTIRLRRVAEAPMISLDPPEH